MPAHLLAGSQQCLEVDACIGQLLFMILQGGVHGRNLEVGGQGRVGCRCKGGSSWWHEDRQQYTHEASRAVVGRTTRKCWHMPASMSVYVLCLPDNTLVKAMAGGTCVCVWVFVAVLIWDLQAPWLRDRQ